MCALNGLNPWKQEEQGDKLVSALEELLDSRGAELSQSRRRQARDTLTSYVDLLVLVLRCTQRWCLHSVQDHKAVLSDKRLLDRIKPAKLYAKKAREALDDITVSRTV
jgi:hypothetical protein